MKKLFTLLAAVMFVTLAVNARQSWDFRKWSAATLSALQVDMEVNGANTNWRNYESDATKADQQHYWIARKMAGTLVTNDGSGDKVIKETEGLTFGASAAKKLVISYNHNNKGENGGSFLWFNGKNETMTIPNVVGGQKLKTAIESHSGTEARGFTITFNGTTLTSNAADGKFVPVEYTEYEVDLPEGQGDLVFKTTNGCHLFYVIIGEGDAPTTQKVGYLYYEAAGKAFEELPLYAAVKDLENVTFEPIKVDEAIPAAEALQAYDAIVLDGSIPADADLVAGLKDNIQWQPTLNVNADLAEAFGYGTKVAQTEGAESEMAVIKDIKKNWFAGFEGYDYDEGIGNMVGLTTGAAWPTPLILQGKHATDTRYMVWLDADMAVCNDSVIGYVHNAGHNAYAYYGVAADYLEGTEVILKNIITDLIGSKSEIDVAPIPTFKGEYKEQESTITIANANKNATIYYTIDGSEPTTASLIYTAPLVFYTEATIKAMAVVDGYKQSETVSFDVKLYHQAKIPTISVEGNSDKGDMVVTLSSDEDVDIFYNFSGKATDPSSKYEEPIKINTVCNIYAYAIGKEGVALVTSDVASQQIYANIKNIRRDELAHFNADKSWATLSTDETPSLVLNGTPQTAWANSSNYYFSWGKTAVKSSEDVGDPMIDPATGDPMMDENGNFIYEQKVREPEVTTNANDPDWKLVSQGQVMIHQVISIGKDVGNGEGYNPDNATDLLNVSYMTANDIQCAAKFSGDKYTARIESTKKFQAPFNVLYFAGTANANEKTAVQISADGENWETVGDTVSCSATKRLWKQFEVSYEGTDEVYVRVAHVATGSAAQIYDIYVFNEGEKSKAMMEEYATGISEAVAPEVKKVIRGTYNLAGQKVDANFKGIVIKNGVKVLQ